MKQIYDLQQTIREDEQLVAKLQKQLHFAQGVLNVHRNALTRLLTLPKETPYQAEKVSENVAPLQKGVANKPVRERITLENWKTLGVAVGDKVEVVVSSDGYFDEGVYVVCEVSPLDYDGTLPFRMYTNYDEYWFNMWHENEIYLIRTPEGSLKDK